MSNVIERIGELLEKLQSPDFYNREEAVNELGSFQEDEAVAGLVMALEDNDLGIREIAAENLVKIKGDTASQLLIKFLGSEDIGSRNLASEILVKIGDDAVEALINELENDDHDIRKFVVDIVGLIKSKKSAPYVSGKLQDSNINVVCSAAEALGEIGDAASIKSLIQAYDNNEDIRLQVVEALGKIGGEEAIGYLYEYLNTDDPMILYAGIDAVGIVGNKDSVKHLLKHLESTDVSIAEAAMSAIVNISIENKGAIEQDLPLDKFSSYLFDGIKNKNKKLTEFTLARLKHWYGQDILNSLLEVLHYVDEEDLKSIVTMLGDIGTSASGAIIKQFPKANSELKIIYLNILKQYVDGSIAQQLLVFKNDTDPEVRRNIAFVLGVSGDPSMIDPLKVMTQDKVGHVRAAAYSALGWFCDESDMQFLFEGLNDKYTDVRDAAMGALILLGPQEVVAQFFEDLHHAETERQRIAANALGLIGDPSVVKPLFQALNHPESSIRKSAIDSLAKIRDIENIDPLMLALNDEKSSVRKSACTAIVSIKGQAIIPEIRFLLDDQDIWVRYHMINIIGNSGNADYGEFIQIFIDGNEDILKLAAIKSLTQLGCKDAISEISKLQNDKNQDIVSAAKDALDNLQDA